MTIVLNHNKLSNIAVTSQLLEKQNVVMHDHDYAEFFYIINGRCKHLLNGSAADIGIGDFFLLLPGHCHTFLEQSDDFMHRDVLVSLDYFRSVCEMYKAGTYETLLKREPYLTKLSNAQLHLFESMFSPVKPHSVSFDRERRNCVIVTSLLNAMFQGEEQKNVPQWLIKLAKHLSIPKEFCNPLVDIIKGHMYSQGYACRMFKKYFGVSMSDYFNEQKVIYAQTLISSTDMTIEKICETIGFNSLSYFYRLYKKHTGTTPSANRRRLSDKEQN